MDVYRHVCEKPNIGDEINAWFWQETLGEEIPVNTIPVGGINKFRPPKYIPLTDRVP